MVADPSGATPPARFRLDGNFEPEAFSLDDDRLFLIQYLPAEAPAVYRVTVLDLATGDVRPVTGRFKTPPERMPGVRLGQVYDPVTAQMYTLYSNQPGAYAEGYDHAGGASHDWPEETFVHVLNLREGMGLLRRRARGDVGRHGARTVARALTRRPMALHRRRRRGHGRGHGHPQPRDRPERPRRSRRRGLGPAHVAGGEPRRQTLFVAAGATPGTVSAIATADLTTVDAWPSPLPASGLGLSLDGTGLYVAGGGRIALLDLGTGESRTTVPTPVLEPIVSLDPLPADAPGRRRPGGLTGAGLGLRDRGTDPREEGDTGA